MTNFDFLKKIDNNLYEIITEAEKLYAAEFFEQSMGQTRRFGEQMCKCILKDSPLYDASFDEMLATLKDKAASVPEREFIDDLYFLKKQGNLSIHSSVVKRDGIAALECLKRAFEAAINYAVFYKKGSKNILKKQYDIELLVTGKRGLAEKYQSKKKSQKTPEVQCHTMKPKTKKTKFSIFWILVGISSVISAVMLLIMFLSLNM